MTDAAIHPRRVAVIGGGISGLAAAHRLIERAPETELTLFEASSRLGGVLETVRHGTFLCETGADSFLADPPWAVDLCQRLGIEEELIRVTNPELGALVAYGGRLHPVPRGFLLVSPGPIGPILGSSLLTLGGKLRLLGESFVPPRSTDSDESVTSFARRRLGHTAYERLVQPLVGGIYGADCEQLSMAATLPKYFQQEREHGSLMRARRKANTPATHAGRSGRGARYYLFTTPREGLARLVQALAARLPAGSIALDTPVEAVQRSASGEWTLVLKSPHEQRSFDAVILATPVDRAARLVKPIDATLSTELAGIRLAGMAVVSLGYHSDQLRQPVLGQGFVVPAVESRPIVAGSFSSLKFAGRAPAGQLLVRIFIGGVLNEDLVEAPDDVLREMATGELQQLFAATGDPIHCHIARWPASMPQYEVGHLQRVERIERRVENIDCFALAGNAYRGVGIPQCVRSGEQAADRILGQAT